MDNTQKNYYVSQKIMNKTIVLTLHAFSPYRVKMIIFTICFIFGPISSTFAQCSPIHVSINLDTNSMSFSIVDSIGQQQGNNKDSLLMYLDKYQQNLYESIRLGGESCIDSYSIVINCSEELLLNDFLLFSEHVFRYFDSPALFDIKTKTQTMHVLCANKSRGSLSTNANGDVIDDYGLMLRKSFRVLCTSNKVIIMLGSDTLYSGSYQNLNDKKKFHINDFNTVYKNGLHIIVINATCDTPIKRLMKITEHIDNRNTMYILGRYFSCTSSLQDIIVKPTWNVNREHPSN